MNLTQIERRMIADALSAYLCDLQKEMQDLEFDIEPGTEINLAQASIAAYRALLSKVQKYQIQNNEPAMKIPDFNSEGNRPDWGSP